LQARGVIPHGGYSVQVNAECSQALAEVLGVGVDDLAEEKFGPHRDDFSFQSLTVFPGF
jgi:hypothetical protein